MKIYRFEELKFDLRIGREIDFKYNGIQYSITHNPTGYWFFGNDTKKIYEKICELDNKDKLIDYVKGKEIEEMTIENIFDDGLLDGWSIF